MHSNENTWLVPPSDQQMAMKKNGIRYGRFGYKLDKIRDKTHSDVFCSFKQS